MNRAATLGLLLIAALALGLRWPALDQRPLHTDESVHAIKFLGLWERGVYRYDPHEYHGPSLYYATLPLARLAQACGAGQPNERILRLVPLLFGVGLILLLPLLRDALGGVGVLVAGVLTALSPAYVFYSQYYIHELLLVFFTLLLLGSAWRYWRSGGWAWAVAAGAALGLMHATKETFVFALAAMAFALLATVAWERLVAHEPDGKVVRSSQPTDATAPRSGQAERSSGLAAQWRETVRQHFRWWHLAGAVVVAFAVSLVLFTSWFTNASGPLDSLRTYAPWLSRAGGDSPHTHPWFFYFQRIGWFHVAKGPVWSELLILALGLTGWVTALAGRKPADGCVRFLRFLGFYTVGLTALYVVIPYKTPWCALGFLHGYILLAGAGATVLVGSVRGRTLRWAVSLGLGVATVQLGLQAWRAAYPYATDRRNPYVYAHTSKDLLRLVDMLKAIARTVPPRTDVLIKVMAPGGDCWPLPWYLRDYAAQTGWYPEVPADPYAPLMVVGSKFEANLDERSGKKWLMVGLFEHRPKVFFELYVAFEVWKTYLESRPKPPDDD